MASAPEAHEGISASLAAAIDDQMGEAAEAAVPQPMEEAVSTVQSVVVDAMHHPSPVGTGSTYVHVEECSRTVIQTTYTPTRSRSATPPASPYGGASPGQGAMNGARSSEQGGMPAPRAEFPQLPWFEPGQDGSGAGDPGPDEQEDERREAWPADFPQPPANDGICHAYDSIRLPAGPANVRCEERWTEVIGFTGKLFGVEQTGYCYCAVHAAKIAVQDTDFPGELYRLARAHFTRLEAVVLKLKSDNLLVL